MNRSISQVVSSSSQGSQKLSSSDSDEQTIDKSSCSLVAYLQFWIQKLRKMPYYLLSHKEQSELAQFMEFFIPDRALYQKKGEQFVSKILLNTPSLINCKLCFPQLLKQIHKLISQELHPTLITWHQRMKEKVVENEKFPTFLVLMNSQQQHFVTVQKNIEAFDEDIGRFRVVVNNIVSSQQKIYFDILVPENNVTNVDYSLSQEEKSKIEDKFAEKLNITDPKGNISRKLKFFAVIDEVVYEKITSTEEGKNLVNFYWNNSKKVVRLIENAEEDFFGNTKITFIKEEDLLADTKMHLGQFE